MEKAQKYNNKIEEQQSSVCVTAMFLSLYIIRHEQGFKTSKLLNPLVKYQDHKKVFISHLAMKILK